MPIRRCEPKQIVTALRQVEVAVACAHPSADNPYRSMLPAEHTFMVYVP